MAIRNLILDMGNVLLTWEPRAFALKAAGNQQDADILYDALFDQPEWHLHDAGQVEEAEVLRLALLRAPRRLHETLRRLFEQWPKWMAPIPGMSGLVTAAHEAGLKLYLLSNAGTRFPDELTRRDFYPYFSGMMVSAHERLAKPDVRIYQRLCQRFDLLPRECLFIDDMAANVAGAEQAGLTALLFEGDWQKVADKLKSLGVPISL